VRGTDPTPYLLLPGTARDALTRWHEVFGGELELFTFADFGRSDGPPEHVAHGTLRGPVTLHAADAAPGEEPFASTGLLLSLLGTAEPDELRRWFDRLAEGGTVLAPLAQRPWNAWDGQVRDRYGVSWLIGWEPGEG
jgi:PhnB protein